MGEEQEVETKYRFKTEQEFIEEFGDDWRGELYPQWCGDMDYLFGQILNSSANRKFNEDINKRYVVDLWVIGSNVITEARETTESFGKVFESRIINTDEMMEPEDFDEFMEKHLKSSDPDEYEWKPKDLGLFSPQGWKHNFYKVCDTDLGGSISVRIDYHIRVLTIARTKGSASMQILIMPKPLIKAKDIIEAIRKAHE